MRKDIRENEIAYFKKNVQLLQDNWLKLKDIAKALKINNWDLSSILWDKRKPITDWFIDKNMLFDEVLEILLNKK